MKIFVAGGTGAIGRPLIAELLAKGPALVALTRSQEKAQALVEKGIEPAIADVFDTDAVKAVVCRTQPEIVIEQLTALPKTYTRESMNAAAALDNRMRLEGGANAPLDLILGGRAIADTDYGARGPQTAVNAQIPLPTRPGS